MKCRVDLTSTKMKMIKESETCHFVKPLQLTVKQHGDNPENFDWGKTDEKNKYKNNESIT